MTERDSRRDKLREWRKKYQEKTSNAADKLRWSEAGEGDTNDEIVESLRQQAEQEEHIADVSLQHLLRILKNLNDE